MKLATFKSGDGIPRVGLVSSKEDSVLDVAAAYVAVNGHTSSALSDMLALIDSGSEGLDQIRHVADDPTVVARHSVDLKSVGLFAPLPKPRQIRDFSVFERHLRDAPWALMRMAARVRGEKEPDPKDRSVAPIYRELPLFYFSNHLNVAGPGTNIAWPDTVNFLDFELEIGVIIGKRGTNIARDGVDSHIFGYTIFNDVSARDIQHRQMTGGLGPCKAKSFDGCNVLGPWIVTPDEIPDLYHLPARVRVNGEVWIETTTEGMIHKFPEMIAFASENETLHPGELLGSGTVGGCCGLELDRWINRGDVVELEIDGIGRLTNKYG